MAVLYTYFTYATLRLVRCPHPRPPPPFLLPSVCHTHFTYATLQLVPVAPHALESFIFRTYITHATLRLVRRFLPPPRPTPTPHHHHPPPPACPRPGYGCSTGVLKGGVFS